MPFLSQAQTRKPLQDSRENVRDRVFEVCTNHLMKLFHEDRYQKGPEALPMIVPLVGKSKD